MEQPVSRHMHVWWSLFWWEYGRVEVWYGYWEGYKGGPPPHVGRVVRCEGLSGRGDPSAGICKISRLQEHRVGEKVKEGQGRGQCTWMLSEERMTSRACRNECSSLAGDIRPSGEICSWGGGKDQRKVYAEGAQGDSKSSQQRSHLLEFHFGLKD